jgi:endonuclease III
MFHGGLILPADDKISTGLSRHSNFRKGGQLDKLPFDIHQAVRLLREAVQPYPKAALFELAEMGYHTVFQQVVACIISIRTRDEVTLPAAQRLFAAAATTAQVAALDPAEIERLIMPSTFHERKALQIKALAQRAAQEFGGELPCDAQVIQSFAGVGLKCANLTLGIACRQPRVSADVHVDRVTNRWGYIQTRTPEQTSQALENNLPLAYWIEINALLVPFGKHICTGVAPRCSTCPLLAMCRQVGVTVHR